MNHEPLIYTSKGNVPVSSLTYETEWTVNDAFIQFVERHRDASGEVVKESAHVYDRVGISATAIAASLG